MKLFKTVDEKLAEIGFTKEKEDKYGCEYKRKDKKYNFTQKVDILHKKSGRHILQSYDPDLGDDKGILVKDVIVNDSELIKQFDNRIINTLVKCENYIKYDLSGKGHFSQQDRMYFLDNKAPTVPRCRTETKFNVWLGGETYKKTCPVEIERLQTLPDGYTEFGLDEDGSIVKMPKTRRFEAIGNGWTVDIIAWIFSFMKEKQDANNS